MFWTKIVMTPMAKPTRNRAIFLALALGLAACAPGQPAPEAGSQINEGGFGNPTRTNAAYHTGQLQYATVLAQRFAQEVPTTITFAFNSATLDPEARAVLDQQAAFIRHFPEVRFSVYGHTDLVGGAAYNQHLGLRRARAAVNYLVSRGVLRDRLAALVSLGETQPIIAIPTQERRNRRTVTEVTGFVQTAPAVLDGRYAQIVYRAYASGVAGGT